MKILGLSDYLNDRADWDWRGHGARADELIPQYLTVPIGEPYRDLSDNEETIARRKRHVGLPDYNPWWDEVY